MQQQPHILLVLWTWFALIFCSTVAFVVQVALVPLTWWWDRNHAITGRVYRIAAICTAKLTPLWDFGVYGELPARWPTRTVVVGNHCSQTDPFLISHLPWEMKWLAKASLFRVPVMGWALTLAGDIPVVRGERTSAKSAMARCRRYLDRGMPVMIFPEGTRSLSDELGPFKDGAFQLAIEAGADILPLAVHGTATALPVHDWKFGRARARVIVGTPISTAGMTLDDVQHLKQIVRAEIEVLRARVRPHTV